MCLCEVSVVFVPEACSVRVVFGASARGAAVNGADRFIPQYRLNLTSKEAEKGRRVLIRLNDWLATDGRYRVVPQDVLDHLGGLLAECHRAEREVERDA